MSFYALDGPTKQIFTSWADARPHCQDVSGVRYKKFHSRAEAEDWLGLSPPGSRSRSPLSPRSSSGGPSTTTAAADVHVYTDGACTKNGSSSARAGIGVFWGQDDPRNVSEPLPPGERHTNNRAELLAIERALDGAEPVLRRGATLHIHTDSQYSHKALTLWINNWIKKGWITAKGTPVENRDLLERIHGKLASTPTPVQWHYVAAHTGDPGNEAADRLAVAGAKAAGANPGKRKRALGGTSPQKRGHYQ